MKKSFSIFGLIIFITLKINARENSNPFENPVKQFFAISVADVVESAEWYKKIFDLTETADLKADDGSVHTKILESDFYLIELSQHKTGKSLKEAAPQIERNYLLHGFFKVGFYVKDFEAAVNFLKENNVQFFGRIIEDEKHGIKFILIKDNSGNTLQIFAKI
ncbi:MAG: hypothetical protein A2068_03270 [Ignavibacteria bacterium GWB2_35_6b]|nr:MAG: hypothetical protein A2068_03270 [Ignavibacteria bacterium GWB2_35_6b]